MGDSPFMTAQELADFLNIPARRIKEYAGREPFRLPPRFSKPGQTLMWHKDDVTEWVEKQRRESKALALSQRQRVGNIRLVGSRSSYAR